MLVQAEPEFGVQQGDRSSEKVQTGKCFTVLTMYLSTYFVWLLLAAHFLTPSKYQLVESLGEPIKAYGADAGGKREGRRYHVESHSYQAEDGSNRCVPGFFVTVIPSNRIVV